MKKPASSSRRRSGCSKRARTHTRKVLLCENNLPPPRWRAGDAALRVAKRRGWLRACDAKDRVPAIVEHRDGTGRCFTLFAVPRWRGGRRVQTHRPSSAPTVRALRCSPVGFGSGGAFTLNHIAAASAEQGSDCPPTEAMRGSVRPARWGADRFFYKSSRSASEGNVSLTTVRIEASFATA